MQRHDDPCTRTTLTRREAMAGAGMVAAAGAVGVTLLADPAPVWAQPARPVADDLVITTNEPDNLVFLHGEFPDLRIQLVCDAFDFRGALPGLFTALQAASNPFVAVVACDMVFASASLVDGKLPCDATAWVVR